MNTMAKSCAALALVLAASGAQAIPVCGDGVCDGSAWPPESLETCPDDCGGQPSNQCVSEACTSCDRPTSSTVDLDIDGIPDQLEHDLVHRYFPRILLQWADVDRDESYLWNGFSTPYVVQSFYDGNLCKNYKECLEIRIPVLFMYDHGDGIDLGLGDHYGDSEFYAVLVRRTTDWSTARTSTWSWRVIRDFTAAHWTASFGESSVTGFYGHCTNRCATKSDSACKADPDCQVVSYGWGMNFCLPKLDIACYSDTSVPWYLTLYSAESKHGLYHTDAECDSGGFHGSDDCPNNQYDMRQVKGGLLANAGQPWANSAFDGQIVNIDACMTYSVWGGQKFGQSTPIRTLLTKPLPWMLPE
jgi:hypothetical protein